ncbi:MAG: penicillin-binding protein activator [Gammaproteobacteria bacterium]
MKSPAIPPRFRALLMPALALLLGACVSAQGVSSRSGSSPYLPGERSAGLTPEFIAGLPPQAVIEAAEQALAAGDTGRAAQLAAALPETLPDFNLAPRLKLLRAELALLDGQPQRALEALPPGTSDPAIGLRLEALRARAAFALQDPVAGVQAYIERRRWITDPAERMRNDDELWLALNTVTLGPESLSRSAEAGREVQGWIELALIARQQVSAGTLEAWRQRHPHHPGAERLGMIASSVPLIGQATARLALLLPLSGPFAPSAEAVRDGFFSAYLTAGEQLPVTVYDTGATDETALAAYQRALAEGAGFIIGPLRKEAIAQLTQYGQPPVPVLALNTLDDGRQVPFNFFQFGLSPEDEARAAAERAVAEGGRRAVALVPKNEWGERVLAAFRERLEGLGGTLLDAARYESETRDFSASIQSLLRLNGSQARHRAVVEALGARVQYEPRRRDDMDFIFFAARRQEGRLIWPQFRFHRADGVPAYATSLVYDGSGDPDLSGVRFCDMPWMLEPNTPLRLDSDRLASARAYPRLFALGVDAFTLVLRISRGEFSETQPLPSATGELRLGPNGLVSRHLSCAQLDARGARLLPALP